MDEHLSWKHHTAELCKKLSRTSGIFFKVRHYCPLPMLICLYNSLFSSFLNYGIAAWGLTFESYLNPLFRLQKRVLRCIKFEPFTAPSAPIFQSLKILKLEDTLHLNILTFVYKAINRLSPSCFHNSNQTQLSIRLALVRQPEVISLNPLRILHFIVYKQFNNLAPNFGTLFHFSYVLLTPLQFFSPN